MSLFVKIHPLSYIDFIILYFFILVYFSFIYFIQCTVIYYVLLVTCSLTFFQFSLLALIELLYIKYSLLFGKLQFYCSFARTAKISSSSSRSLLSQFQNICLDKNLYVCCIFLKHASFCSLQGTSVWEWGQKLKLKFGL